MPQNRTLATQLCPLDSASSLLAIVGARKERHVDNGIFLPSSNSCFTMRATDLSLGRMSPEHRSLLVCSCLPQRYAVQVIGSEDASAQVFGEKEQEQIFENLTQCAISNAGH